MDGVAWLVWSTVALLVLVNLGIGGLALWSYRSGRRVTQRLLATDELDVYHATWLSGPGYGSSAQWSRRDTGAEVALRSLIADGLVRLDTDAGIVPHEETAPQTAPRTAPQTATPPEHPITREAWRFTRAAWSEARPVTVKALIADPAFTSVCTSHAERLAGQLPAYRTGYADLRDRTLFGAGLIGAGWITLNTCFLLVRTVFLGESDAPPHEDPELLMGVMTATLGTAVLSLVLLVPLHFAVWNGWQDRWPQQLRKHCQTLLRQESRDWVPLMQIPRGN
ncbi:hypothetical protein [Streptomyces sp. NPDC059076]|uniref:hypothetical protein n=1 Tax=unclassified Streptomyces TaxID=2593676 RepID=UPI0036841D1E